MMISSTFARPLLGRALRKRAAFSTAVLLACGLCASGAVAQDDARLQRAKALIADQRWEQALTLLDAFVAEDAGALDALYARAELHRERGALVAARDDYSRVVELRPDDREAWSWLASLERELSNWQQSIDGYSEALRLEPCSTRDLSGRAGVYSKIDDLESAETDLRSALDCEPSDSTSVRLLAEVLVRMGRWDEARQEVGTAFDNAVLDDTALEQALGELFLQDRKYSRSARHFETALASDPSRSEAWRGLGDVRRHQGRWEESLRAYIRSEELEPGVPSTLAWIGSIGYRQHRYGDAERALDSLLAKSPGDARALAGKAKILRERGDRQGALALVRRALELDPNHSEALVVEASLVGDLGQREEARSRLREALGGSPTDKDARSGLDQLGPRHSWRGEGSDDSSQVIEGLADAGLVVDGFEIEPTRIEYIDEGAGMRFDSRLGDRTGLYVSAEQSRQAVFDRSAGSNIYDFDVTRVGAGIDRQLAGLWRLDLGFGAARYEDRSVGPSAIPEDSHALGRLGLRRQTGSSSFEIYYSRDPFLQRSFASSTDFAVFERDTLGLHLAQRLSPRLDFTAAAGAEDYGSASDSTVFANAALLWNRGSSRWGLRVARAPLMERFFRGGSALSFIDYDYLSLTGGTSLFHPRLRFSGEARYGLFEESERFAVSGSQATSLGLDNNEHELLFGRLEWTPPRQRVLRAGVEYRHERFEFDTGRYGNNDRSDVLAFAELVGDSGDRLIYGLRYAHGFRDDDRNPDYDSDEVSARAEWRLGGSQYRDNSVWLGLEAGYNDNDLDEDGERFRAYLRLPIGGVRSGRTGRVAMSPKAQSPDAQLPDAQLPEFAAPPEPIEVAEVTLGEATPEAAVEEAVAEPEPVAESVPEPPTPELVEIAEVASAEAADPEPDPRQARAEQVAEIASIIRSWANAWSRQDVDSYLSYYAVDFLPADGQSRDEWSRSRRERVSAPSSIEVGLGRIDTALEEGGRAIARFVQTYSSDLFEDAVSKALVLVQAPGGWRIVREAVDTVANAAAAPSSDTSTVGESVDSSIEEAVVAWASAWSGKDVDAYLASYSSDFEPQVGQSRADWEAQRRDRLTAPTFIEVVTDDLETEMRGPDRAQTRFRQTYRSDAFQDVVQKTLDMVREGGQWRIASERSAPLE